MSTFFNDIEELRDVISVPSSLDLSILTPDLVKVQEGELKSILGVATLNLALQDYTTNNSAVYGDLIKHCQRVSGALAFYNALPVLNVIITNGGLQQNAATDGTEAATMWRTRDFQNKLLKDIGVYYDQLLSYLDENESSVNLAQYLLSAERKNWKSSFIYSPKQASKYVSTKLNYYTLYTMAATIDRISRKYIKELVCSELYTDLIEKNRTRTVWGVYEPLRELIEEAVINLSLAAAVPELRMAFDEEGAGLLFNRVEKSGNSSSTDEPAIYKAITLWNANGSYALSQLKKELKNNVTDYPLYESSLCNTSPTERKAFNASGSVGSFI
ncbi:MAG: DUF6712 family protein [Aureispira sp.]